MATTEAADLQEAQWVVDKIVDSKHDEEGKWWYLVSWAPCEVAENEIESYLEQRIGGIPLLWLTGDIVSAPDDKVLVFWNWTWEPSDVLSEDCEDSVLDYWARKVNRGN